MSCGGDEDRFGPWGSDSRLTRSVGILLGHRGFRRHRKHRGGWDDNPGVRVNNDHGGRASSSPGSSPVGRGCFRRHGYGSAGHKGLGGVIVRGGDVVLGDHRKDG